MFKNENNDKLKVRDYSLGRDQNSFNQHTMESFDWRGLNKICYFILSFKDSSRKKIEEKEFIRPRNCFLYPWMAVKMKLVRIKSDRQSGDKKQFRSTRTCWASSKDIFHDLCGKTVN